MKLFTKLITMMLAFSIVIVGVLALFFYTAVGATIQREISGNQLEIASQTMDKIDRLLYGRTVDIRELADRTTLAKAVTPAASATDMATATQNLDSFKTIASWWADFALLDARGTTRVATEAADLSNGFLTSNPDLTTLYQQALQGRTVYSNAINSQVLGGPTLVVMTPLKNGSTVVGVAVGELAWSQVQEILQSVHGSELTLLDKTGVLIGSSDARSEQGVFAKSYATSEVFKRVQKGSGSAILPGITKPTVKTVASYVSEAGFSDYTGNGWSLILSTPAATAFADTSRLTLALAVVFAGLMVVATGALLVFLNRQVARPIRALGSAVGRVSLGDLSQTVAVTSRDEVGKLATSFNEMTHQLAGTHRSLQQTTQVAQEGRAQLLSSINGLRQGFVLTDVRGQVVVVNAAALGFVLGPKPRSAFSIADLAASLPPTLKLAEAIAHTIEHQEQAKFPALAMGGRFLNLYLSPVVNESQPIGCALLLEDVTEERILQRSRDEFFSIASHELRTPLTAIRGNTALIQQYFPEAMKDPSMSEMIGDIHESSMRLIEIVNDFLDMSRLEQNKMQFSEEAFTLESVIEKVIYEMAAVSREKGVALKFDQETLGKLPAVWADQNRVKQVLYNLMGNALKFTAKGQVIINCLIQDGFLKVCVSDTGQGISAEGQQLLFHKFQQSADSILTRDNTRGTGLGLYISKLLVEHMGGQIRLEHSELGKGTTFSFTLPITDKTPGAAVAPTMLTGDMAAEKPATTKPATPDPVSAPGKAPEKTAEKNPKAPSKSTKAAKHRDDRTSAEKVVD